MSIVIADSGATKTEWCCKTEFGSRTISTEGLNPFYHSTESIADTINEHLLPKLEEPVDKLVFYGAGCDGNTKKEIVRRALDQCFSSEIVIHHDLLAAARACFHDEAGIACILGTGSNSCLYDGKQIVEHIPSLAFILGDEGSAGYFGKKLVNAYFRDEIPGELQEDLERNYNMSLTHIKEGLYDGSQKSRFIASYSRFLGDHADHPFIENMLRQGFENFVRRILLNYTNATEHEVRFIGSVAHAHQELITEILNKHQLTAGKFIKDPMESLIKYHNRKEA